jgi:hypothetical protein
LAGQTCNLPIDLVIHKIAFEYYPLDLNPTSNPFLVSWWPLALGDPALFHVSLQTACLDEELSAQRGFQTSELLMADSLALLRQRFDDLSLAMQDVTMNSIITLAAIEVRLDLMLCFPSLGPVTDAPQFSLARAISASARCMSMVPKDW